MKPSLVLAFPLALSLAWSASAQDVEAPAGPPATRREAVEEVLHGETVVDPYRWLEGDAQGASTAEVSSWTDAQNAYTRAVLDGLPRRAAVEARLRQLMEIGSVGTPTLRGERLFHTRREGTQDQSVLLLRPSPDRNAPARVLLDPAALDADGLISLDWYVPSPDGALLAFGISRAGDENSTCHVLDVETGEWLADAISGKVGGVDWLPDGSGFFYSALKELRDPYSTQIRFHRLGRHPRHDAVLITQESTTWGPFATPSDDARWLIVGDYTSTRANDLWVVDLTRWFQTGELIKTPILVGADVRCGGPVVGDTLFLRTSLDAPNGRVFAVDLNRPEREHWKEIIPERKDAALRSISRARGMLVATYLKNASTQIERFAHDGTPLGAIELPGIGSGSVRTHPDRSEAFMSFASYDVPRSIYRLDLRSGERTLWERAQVPVDPESVEVKQVWVTSKDGTKVSMFLIHKKGLELNGDNPTLLYGYGGFNISMTPYFSATQFVWFEAGGVYAVANLRGGGEYGDAWHQAGQLEKKQNVFDDFYAAAEWLIANNYTSSDRLAIRGGSNGGLLTGAAIVQRPELFRAAISAVPLLDMLRYQRFLMARFWVPEYGTAEDKDQFAFLRAYSPYHHVKPKTPYPAVLLTAGENDSRVHPLHARKMAAALQAATSSDPATRPVLLWVDRDAGHGSGKPLSLRIRDRADSLCFLLWQLGALDDAAKASALAPGSPPSPADTRFTYTLSSAGTPGLEVVWEITSIEGDTIHYTVATLLNGSAVGAPVAARWQTPPEGAGSGSKASPTQTITIGGRSFTCRAVTTGAYTSWIHFKGDRPAFPPIIRQEKGGTTSMELIRIE